MRGKCGQRIVVLGMPKILQEFEIYFSDVSGWSGALEQIDSLGVDLALFHTRCAIPG